ncbi:hypothetical protein EFD55_18840 [Rhizobium pisi]|uniref:Uncharacterized protein n=1 Tax=Rhizobium pisi TaxID=574561 RepID=A0A427MXI3_9HYPH|nr:hypothetical protein EFD55_18840 [Rhizobium pisi]
MLLYGTTAQPAQRNLPLLMSWCLHTQCLRQDEGSQAENSIQGRSGDAKREFAAAMVSGSSLLTVKNMA